MNTAPLALLLCHIHAYWLVVFSIMVYLYHSRAPYTCRSAVYNNYAGKKISYDNNLHACISELFRKVKFRTITEIEFFKYIDSDKINVIIISIQYMEQHHQQWNCYHSSKQGDTSHYITVKTNHTQS